MKCLTIEDFERLAGGRLDSAVEQDLSDHLSSCRQCRQAYSEFSRDEKLAVEAGGLLGDVTETMGTVDVVRVTRTGKVSRQFPTIDGYRILDVLGQGGMGTVYRAIQTKLDRTVALKVLHAVIATASSSAVTRFRKEAAAAARLHHTNIIPIYDFGECKDGHFYAMELVSGLPLDQLIRRFAERHAASASPDELLDLLRTATGEAEVVSDTVFGTESSIDRRLDTSAVMSMPGPGRPYYRHVALWMADAADALHYAHAQGIVHRDIKPSNLILSSEGRVMLADFGLAKTEGDLSVTQTGSLLGTLRYMSPEQAMAKRVRVDHRTDIYSLGVTLYELLCFEPAYSGVDEKEILGDIIAREPKSLRKINSNIPGELEIICGKCMEKLADARFVDAGELADDLRRYLRDLPIVARRPDMLARAIKFTRRHKARLTATVAGVLLLIAVPVILHFSKLADVAEKQAILADAASQAAWVAAKCDSGINFASQNPPQWEAAVQDLTLALQKDPKHVDSLIGLAWVMLERHKIGSGDAAIKQLTKAEELSAQALMVEPDNLIAYAYRGVALTRLERHQDAISVFKSIIREYEQSEDFKQGREMNPQYYASLSNLGKAYALTHQFTDALPWFQKGAEAAGRESGKYGALAWRNLAVIELFLDMPDALTHAVYAFECDRRDVLIAQARIESPILFARGLQTGSDREESEQFVLARRLTHKLLALIKLTLQDAYDPGGALEQAQLADNDAMGQDGLAKRIRALAHLRQNEPIKAIEHAQAAIELRDMPTFNHLIMALAEIKQGHQSAAQGHLEAANAAWPADLAERSDGRVTAAGTDLWIESANLLFLMRDEVGTALSDR